ncbi:hypothetical protein CMI46_02345 [Candidatus Pacearchaeota archaeon]|nr:hypothetical protein [Candidatus Pacearchaeota archaeon]
MNFSFCDLSKSSLTANVFSPNLAGYETSFACAPTSLLISSPINTALSAISEILFASVKLFPNGVNESFPFSVFAIISPELIPIPKFIFCVYFLLCSLSVLAIWSAIFSELNELWNVFVMAGAKIPIM